MRLRTLPQQVPRIGSHQSVKIRFQGPTQTIGSARRGRLRERGGYGIAAAIFCAIATMESVGLTASGPGITEASAMYSPSWTVFAPATVLYTWPFVFTTPLLESAPMTQPPSGCTVMNLRAVSKLLSSSWPLPQNGNRMYLPFMACAIAWQTSSIA